MDYFSVSHGEIGLLHENHQALVKMLVLSSYAMNLTQQVCSSFLESCFLHVSQVNVVHKGCDSQS